MKKNFIKSLCLLVISLFLVTSVYSQNQKTNRWVLHCKTNTPCFISQKIKVNFNGESKVLGGASIFYASKNLVLRLRFSHNAKKEQGVGIKIDKNQALHLPITACDTNICEANVSIDDQLLSELLAGKVMSIAYFDKQAKQKTLPVFLNNFDEVFKNLSKKQFN
tara:strand:+ start:6764 stop:7255 length:492 start_codon:yes stop_codon:yes gene_type:complete